MNSLPMPNTSGMVSGTTEKFTSSAAHLHRSASRNTGA